MTGFTLTGLIFSITPFYIRAPVLMKIKFSMCQAHNQITLEPAVSDSYETNSEE